MKAIIFATLLLALSAGSALAQGVPAGYTPTHYGHFYNHR